MAKRNSPPITSDSHDVVSSMEKTGLESCDLLRTMADDQPTCEAASAAIAKRPAGKVISYQTISEQLHEAADELDPDIPIAD